MFCVRVLRVLQLDVPLETVFLDAGGVLIFPNWNRISDALGRQGVGFHPPPCRLPNRTRDEYSTTSRSIGATTDASRGWLFFDLILENAGITPSPATKAALAELHEYHVANNLWEWCPPGVRPALDRAARHGPEADDRVEREWHALRAPRADWSGRISFDCVLDSHDEQVEKPDPRLFEIALARSGARRESTIHVGDLYHIDVVGARNAGLRAVLLDEADLRPDADCPRVNRWPSSSRG